MAKPGGVSSTARVFFALTAWGITVGLFLREIKSGTIPHMQSTGQPRVLLYARVSTADKGQDYTAQLDELQRVADQRRWFVVGRYHDVTSGAKARRRGLDAALARCRAGEVDIFAAVAVDRFARSVVHLIQLADELEALGVQLACTREAAMDATTPAGRAFLQVRAVFAEFERNLTRQRIREGLAVRRARGVKLGRRRTINYARIDQARALRAQPTPASWGAIAKALGGSRGAWSRALSRDPSITPGAEVLS